MTGTGKKLKELSAVLSKDHSLKISQAIRVLRNEPPVAGVIALLISHYNSSTNYSVRQLIKEFMNDIKTQASCIEVIEEIKKDYKTDTLQMLASSCWQSGLDYSDFCNEFSDLFLAGDYMTALECFTVIEASVQKIPGKKKESIIKKIKEAMPGVTGEKRALAIELISLLG
jgi:hypothetical protein